MNTIKSYIHSKGAGLLPSSLSRRAGLLLLLFFVMAVSATAQDITITGTVTDDTGEPLPGANVIVKNATGLGTITNMDGK